MACAADPQQPQVPVETLEGIQIHRYRLTPSAGSSVGYLREYGEAATRLRRLVRRLARERRFDIVHAANPPDFLLATAADLKRCGTRLVFDHHDLTPELFRSRFGGGAPYRAVLAAERVAFALADVVISTNASYRQIAIERGRKDPADVFVVRNGPDLERFTPVAPDPSLRRGRPHLLAYLGIMGPQDGIDDALHALAWLHRRRDDWHAAFVGRGDMLDEMQALSKTLGIAGNVEFMGWRGDDDICRILSTADVCIAPDPPSPLNDVSTMIKIPEYLAMGRPVVSYDLRESRVSAGAAALYAETSEPTSLGRCIEILLQDPDRRARMGKLGLQRVRHELAWQHSAPVLQAAYERAMTRPRRVRRGRAGSRLRR